MPLIECPQCHHRVSSVASACPECGSPIAERLWDEMRRGEYYPCGKCGEPVAVHASVCRNCGVPDPRRRRFRISPRFAVGVGVAAALLVTAVSSSQRPERPPLSAIPDTAAGSIVTTEDTVPVTPDPVLSNRQIGPPPPRPSREAAPPPPIPDSTTDGQVRWADTWVNVRAGRGLSYPVVLTLDPGEMVVVDSLRLGWWVVVADGERVGYVANSVLRPTPSNPSSP